MVKRLVQVAELVISGGAKALIRALGSNSRALISIILHDDLERG